MESTHANQDFDDSLQGFVPSEKNRLPGQAQQAVFANGRKNQRMG
jgi:hypothetical protein